MEITMVAAGRDFLSDGLTQLLTQTRAAVREEKKAFLPIAKGEKQIELLQEAAKYLPSSEQDRGEKEWEIPGELLAVYRDSLLMCGFTLDKLRKREVELRVDPAATKNKMDAVQAILRSLGDQRDLFQMLEEENRKAERAARDEGQGSFSDELTPPPKAKDVEPLTPFARGMEDGPERIAASPRKRRGPSANGPHLET